MKIYTVASIFMSLVLVSGLLAACAAIPASAPQGSATASSGSQQFPAMTPMVSTAIVGTAVEGGSQSLPTPTDTVPSAIDGNQTVTFTDNGKTLIFHPGQRFVLMLPEGYDWTLDPLDPAIVSLVMGVMPVRGSQGVFEAHQAGRTNLSASGDPQCRSAQPPCMMPSILFEVTIVVQ